MNIKVQQHLGYVQYAHKDLFKQVLVFLGGMYVELSGPDKGQKLHEEILTGQVLIFRLGQCRSGKWKDIINNELGCQEGLTGWPV